MRRRMGAVVETPAIYTALSARDNLKQQYRVLGLPSFDGIDELPELVGLSDSGRKRAGDFSLGMRRRLGIAIALCGNPDFLVLDEPINGLDPQGIVEIRELILKLNRERQITVLISSHILDELAKLATHYGFIDRGRIVREMSAAELEAACRKCVKLTVTDTKKLAATLDEMNLEYRILDGATADVFGNPNLPRLAMALALAVIETLVNFNNSNTGPFCPEGALFRASGVFFLVVAAVFILGFFLGGEPALSFGELAVYELLQLVSLVEVCVLFSVIALLCRHKFGGAIISLVMVFAFFAYSAATDSILNSKKYSYEFIYAGVTMESVEKEDVSQSEQMQIAVLESVRDITPTG